MATIISQQLAVILDERVSAWTRNGAASNLRHTTNGYTFEALDRGLHPAMKTWTLRIEGNAVVSRCEGEERNRWKY